MTTDLQQPSPTLEQAETELTAGNMAGAEQLFRAHLQEHPDDAHAHNRLGVCLVRGGQLREAAESFEEAVRLDPTHARAITNLGNLRYEAGDMAEAERLHRLALEIDPDLAYAWGNLAAVLKRQRRIGEAVKAHKQATRLETKQHTSIARQELRESINRPSPEYDRASGGRPWLKWALTALVVAVVYYFLRQ